ncbi:MAG TPA: sigma-70 family RNA polymerase sigma factor [Thermomicrobiaceae bacterium]|nr:sigma-70 family RNA polymerase sigma factor [Thermomicrobiaceae bacterium]
MSALPQPLESLGDFDPTPDLDARLNTLALRARTDPAARNALYAALSFKIARFVRHYRYRVERLHACDLEDIAQEGFIVFCDLVQSWPGQESFLGYFFSRFPWRLARAIDQLERGWPADRLQPLPVPGDATPDMPRMPRILHTPPDPADLFLLSELGAGLDPRSRSVLELHIGYGLHLSEIARLLGIRQRAMYSLWDHLLAELRTTLEDTSTPPRTTTRCRRGDAPNGSERPV